MIDTEWLAIVEAMNIDIVTQAVSKYRQRIVVGEITAMAHARMVTMRMGYDGSGHWLPWVDVGIERGTIQSVAGQLDSVKSWGLVCSDHFIA
ncbi:hypothetical protein GCM10022278_09020 [Allohahella marinimesophila]|uniref:Uncharacterized protein n=1 Tax=Allohahella marinimesophila TaxID=1054972 RepID=A0ABP7NRD7_9GAMM